MYKVEDWKQFANCKGKPIGMFFDDYEDSVEVQIEVNRLCSNCVVRRECLEFAEANGLQGAFGRKLFPGQKIKRKRNVKVAA